MGNRRHERIPRSEPAALATGDETFDGTVTDVSESGAAIDFALPTGESRVRFDLGTEVHVESQSLAERQGRVVRNYDGGFALNFDGFKIAPDDG